MERVEVGKYKQGVVSGRKKKARKVVYQTKCKAERKRFRNIMQ